MAKNLIMKTTLYSLHELSDHTLVQKAEDQLAPILDKHFVITEIGTNVSKTVTFKLKLIKDSKEGNTIDLQNIKSTQGHQISVNNGNLTIKFKYFSEPTHQIVNGYDLQLIFCIPIDDFTIKL